MIVWIGAAKSTGVTCVVPNTSDTDVYKVGSSRSISADLQSSVVLGRQGTM